MKHDRHQYGETDVRVMDSRTILDIKNQQAKVFFAC